MTRRKLGQVEAMPRHYDKGEVRTGRGNSMPAACLLDAKGLLTFPSLWETLRNLPLSVYRSLRCTQKNDMNQ